MVTLVCPGVYVSSLDESYEACPPEVTHVLNVASEVHVPDRVGKTYAKIAIEDDDPTGDIAAILDPCVEFVSNAIASGGTVLVHCFFGMSRSACVCLAYRCLLTGEAFADALRDLRASRPIVEPFDPYAAQTEAWLDRKRLKTST